MERFTILVGRLHKSVTATNYYFKVILVGRFMPLVSGIGRLVESPLHTIRVCPEEWSVGFSVVAAR